ncbi:hypothetical protein DB347_24015 [Opitutaceae bacterium EW11]|nr:hypothetical protein DB347_24015 [Opitutaceae bacterium EW11]
METTLDLSRWRERPRSVAYRRWTIAQLGLRQLLSTRLFRLVLIVAWTAGLLIAASAFVFSQAVSTGGWLETYAAQLGPRFSAIASAIGALILLYPDICVGGLFTLLFWAQSSLALTLSLVALTIVVPGLVTRDRASEALTVYLSRPLTSVDYLLGKLGIVAGVLLLTWTGPLLAGWLLGMVLAPGRDFIVYSLEPLGRALLFNGIGLVSIASLALGVSALTRTSRNTILLWLGLWLIVGGIAQAPNNPEWLRRASFTYDLDQIRKTILKPADALRKAGSSLPLLDRNLARNLQTMGNAVDSGGAAGPLLGLGVIVVLSSAVFFRRLRPE